MTSEFSEIYRRYASDVFRFALYLTGNHADAEDITAETFVRAWTSGEAIRSATVKGYLCTIARNLFLHGARRQSRQVGLKGDVPDLAAGPEELAGHKAELDRVISRLQTLPEINRAALLMRALEDLPYEEIAIALGISTSAAKVKVHRARLALERWRDDPGERT